MVVLSAGIVTKSGKALFAANFNLEMERARVEGLLTAFPKLVNAGNQESTYIETDTVRYVYQALDNLYLLLITNKTSNILNDIATLGTLAKLVPENTNNHTLEEYDVIDSFMELYNAFSEVIEIGGYRAGVTLQQVKTYLQMSSHEERIQEMIQKNKMKEAEDVAKRKAKQFHQERGEGPGMRIPGIGSYRNKPQAPQVDSHGLPIGESSSYHHTERDLSPPSRNRSSPTTKPAVSGMKLGGNPTATQDFVKGLQEDGAIDEREAEQELAPQTTQLTETPIKQQVSALPRVQRKSTHIALEERVSVILDKDGGVQSMEIKGDLTLILTPDSTGPQNRLQVRVRAGDNPGFQFKTHPLINKNLFTKQQLLTLKDPAKGFPLSTPLGLVKWRYVAKDEDESLVPLVI